MKVINRSATTCEMCGFSVSGSSDIRHHVRNIHGITISDYRSKFGVKRIVGNKKYINQTTDVACHICGKNFSMDTKQYEHRLRLGKNRFACPSLEKGKRSDCVKKLMSLTIGEVRHSEESKAKTAAKMRAYWADPEF